MSSAKEVPAERREDLLHFRRGLKFTEELLAENERLRYRLAMVESELDGPQRPPAQPVADDELVRELKDSVRGLQGDKAQLLSTHHEVELKNRDYQERYADIEQEHDNLANLYVASYQLHATTTFRQVVQVVWEIVVNLVGVQRFTMFLADAGVLYPLGASTAEPISLGEGLIGPAVCAGKVFVNNDASGPRAVVPLVSAEMIVGALVIDELLAHKAGFTRVDHELMKLLSVHAATALLSSLLREQLGEGSAHKALSIATARRLLG